MSDHILWWTGAINALAVLVAPFIAVWVQRRIDRYKAGQDRKQAIFNALWVNRSRPYYISRVDALNMIDIEFYKNKPVRDAWSDLFAHYRATHQGLTDQQIAQERVERYTTLLYEMSKTLGYSLGRSEIRDGVYRPEFHDTFELIDFETRKAVLELLKRDALPVRFVDASPNTN